MPPTLSTADLARCEAASRALLAPLAAPSVEGWVREASRALRELFAADRFLLFLPTEEPGFFTDGWDPATADAYRRFSEEELRGGIGRGDPTVLDFLRIRREWGIEVYSEPLVDRFLGGRMARSEFFNEVIAPGGLRDLLAMHTTLPAEGGARDAAVSVYYGRPGRGRFGEAGTDVLRLLLPSFKAGLDALVRFRGRLHLLDFLAEPLAAFGADGRELHRNPALLRLLDADPERDAVAAALAAASRPAAVLAFPRARSAPGAALVPPAELRTRRGRYRFRCSALPGGAFGGEAVLVAVSLDSAPALPPPDALRARHGLTAREAEVALLLAEGLTNKRIGERLAIRPGTVRRHVEKVFTKLGTGSRKALALRLMQEGR